MKLAILGTRGVPPRYGGFETFAAELSSRLVKRGHEVTVYGRSDASSHDWRGVHRITLPAIRHKYFETVSHTFLSALDVLRRDFHVLLLCNAANAFVLPLLRAFRFPVAINVDGIEQRRRKWNAIGRAVYMAGESLSALFANRVVADAEVIAAYYRERHQIEPVMIPYGSDFPEEPDTDVLQRLQIESGRFLLFVSRFEPENNPLEVVAAYRKLRTANNEIPPLVMVGAASYAHHLEAELKRQEGGGIIVPGALYGSDYRTLQRNAMVYIQATEVGGTHPALIEAMRSGGCVVAHDTPENREVGGDAVGYFRLRPAENLSGALLECLASPALRESMRRAARVRAAERYGWEAVTDAYERLFAELAHNQ